MHSGRQFGGKPVYSGWQVHEGDSPMTLQIEYGPQGEGVHGSTGKKETESEINSLFAIA